MPMGDDDRDFFTTLENQLTIESSLLESHLEALEEAYAKVSDQNAAAAQLMQEAITMKRRTLESIRRQLEKLHGN